MKEAISNHHINQLKMKYKSALHNIYTKTERCILISGVSPGNIGEAIYEEALEVGYALTPKLHDLDVTSPKSITKYFDNLSTVPDTLIMSHGVSRLDWFEDVTQADINYMIEVNLQGSIYLAQEFVRRSLQLHCQKFIVMIGSMAYKSVLNASATYCATKAGLAMLVRCLGWELAPKGYNVFGVHPSNVQDTPMTRQTIQDIMRYRNIDQLAAEQYWASILPRDEFLTKDEIAYLIKELIQGKLNYLSGSNIELAGGQR